MKTKKIAHNRADGWEAEVRRRMNYKRRRAIEDAVYDLLLLAILAIAVITFVWIGYTSDRDERAAFAAGEAEAEARAAAAGGWEAYIDQQIAAMRAEEAAK